MGAGLYPASGGRLFPRVCRRALPDRRVRRMAAGRDHRDTDPLAAQKDQKPPNVLCGAAAFFRSRILLM